MKTFVPDSRALVAGFTHDAEFPRQVNNGIHCVKTKVAIRRLIKPLFTMDTSGAGMDDAGYEVVREGEISTADTIPCDVGTPIARKERAAFLPAGRAGEIAHSCDVRFIRRGTSVTPHRNGRPFDFELCPLRYGALA